MSGDERGARAQSRNPRADRRQRRRARQTSRRAPIPRPETLGDRKPEYRGGNGREYQNPRRGADGVWLGSVGGDRCQKRDWTAGIGGRAVQLALTISRATVG